MCGICGELAFGGIVDSANVVAMADALAHRGPDDHDVYAAGGLALGHRRLSIIDLSPLGRQPMWTEDGHLALIFNGEVYNFKEIRTELLSRGYHFRSTSDTEVVLKAIDCWGVEAAVTKFIGMFAFAVWNARDRTLSLCRDRAGVKPLYYQLDERGLLFASEPKALYAHPRFRRELSAEGLAQYFVRGYTAAGVTVFARTAKLPAGHVLTVRSDGRSTMRQYWSLDRIERGAFRGTFGDAVEQLGALCDSAFAYRLVADVPVGLFLSGGIDSSLLAATLKSHIGANLLHITIGFEEQLYDETDKARAMAEHLGVPHFVRRLEPPAAEPALFDFVETFDEPFGDTSGIPTLMLSRLARQHVKVALSADGGDEQFCGYGGYVDYRRAYAAMGPVPAVARRVIATTLRRLVPYRFFLSAWAAARGPRWRPQVVAQYEKLTDILATGSAADLIRVMNEKGWTASSVAEVVQPAHRHDHVVFAGIGGDGVSPDGLVDLMMRADYTTFMNDDVLAKVDRASMAASLECRDPLLDHRIAEFAFSLPLEYVYGPGGHKRILKELLRPMAPASVLAAPKRGFSVPLYEWLRGPWKPLVYEYLSRHRVRAVGVLDERTVEREVETFFRYQGCRAERVMLMLVFQLWAERWLSPPRAAAPPVGRVPAAARAV